MYPSLESMITILIVRASSGILTESSSASRMRTNTFRSEDSGLETPIVPISLRIASPSCFAEYFSQFAKISTDGGKYKTRKGDTRIHNA